MLDVACASGALVVLSPVVVGTAVAVRVSLGRPVLFRQERAGLHGTTFRMIKFRTMLDRQDQSGNPLPDADRLTPFGRRLRSWSLDELPELINVVRGDMSIVGPRPLLSKYLPLYTEEQSRRHDVRPGLTGWAQVNGRNNLEWESRLDMDVWYTDHVGLALDARIIWRTIITLLRGTGVAASGHVTMAEFTGSDEPAPPPR